MLPLIIILLFFLPQILETFQKLRPILSAVITVLKDTVLKAFMVYEVSA
jgi:hypothetical protein